MSNFRNIEVTGPISLEKVTHKLPVWSSRTILLGVTGTGKSNFLECLANDKTLGLSKNQLESVTQAIECYRLVNVKKRTNIVTNSDIILIDTPGFSDQKLSEKKIVTMIHAWSKSSMDAIGLVVDRALYFERITDTRVSGGKKRAKELFQMITGEKSAARVTIATTMWDTLNSATQKHNAEARFEEYRTSQWKSFISQGSGCTKFHNNQQSALEVLDYAYEKGLQGDLFTFETNLYIGKDFQKAPYAQYLLERLLERIASLEGQLGVIREDLSQESTMSNTELAQQLLKETAEIEFLLADAQSEMSDFDLPSILEGAKPGFRRKLSGWISGIGRS